MSPKSKLNLALQTAVHLLGYIGTLQISQAEVAGILPEGDTQTVTLNGTQKEFYFYATQGLPYRINFENLEPTLKTQPLAKIYDTDQNLVQTVGCSQEISFTASQTGYFKLSVSTQTANEKIKPYGAFEVGLNDYTGVSHPDVAQARDGSSVAVWQSREAGTDWNIYAQRFDSKGSPIDKSPFLVNTTLIRNQKHPRVAVANDGSFAIVWQGVGTSDETGIYVQRYYSSTALKPMGDESRVNFNTNGNQANPDIAINSDGTIAVAWQTVGATEGASQIYYRVIKKDGSQLPILGDILVNDTSSGYRSNPKISINQEATRNADLMIVWEGKGNGDLEGICEKRFNLRAPEVALNPEFRINSIVDGIQNNPDVAMAADGKAMITWLSNHQPGRSYIFTNSYDFNGNGSQRNIGDIQVNETNSPYLSHPAIAINQSLKFQGDFMIGWSGQSWDTKTLSSEIEQRRGNIEVSTKDFYLNQEYRSNADTEGTQIQNQYGSNNDSVFMQIWNTRGSVNKDGIYLAFSNRPYSGIFPVNRISGGINHLPAPPTQCIDERINTFRYGSQVFPAVAMNPTNADFISAWASADLGYKKTGIYIQRHKINGSLQGSELLPAIQTEALVDATSSIPPVVAMSPKGHSLVAWICTRNDIQKICARLYDTTGTAVISKNNLAGEFYLNQSKIYGNGRGRFDVKLNSDGSFIAVWTTPSKNDVYNLAAQKFDSSGLPIGTEITVENSSTCGLALNPSIAIANDSTLVVAWMCSNSRIFFKSNSFDGFSGNESRKEVNVFIPNAAKGMPGSEGNPVGPIWSGHDNAISVAIDPTNTQNFIFVWDYGRTIYYAGNNTITTPTTPYRQTLAKEGSHPKISIDGSGVATLVWTDSPTLNYPFTANTNTGMEGPTGSLAGIAALRFNAQSGQILMPPLCQNMGNCNSTTGEFIVNQYTPHSQRNPVIASDSIGNFVVLWSGSSHTPLPSSSSEPDTDIYMRRFTNVLSTP